MLILIIFPLFDHLFSASYELIKVKGVLPRFATKGMLKKKNDIERKDVREKQKTQLRNYEQQWLGDLCDDVKVLECLGT